MPTAKSGPDGRLVMRKMPHRPLRVRTHAHSRVSVKESHNKTGRDLAGSVPGMPELWRNQDCVFEGGCNRAEAVSCGCPQCQSARTICDSPFHLSHCDWFTRKQPDRGTVDYPANWSRPARQPCSSLSHMRVSKRQHRLLIDYP